MKQMAQYSLIAFLIAAAVFLGWDLRGGRKLLVDSLQNPVRTTERVAPERNAGGQGSTGSTGNSPASQVETEEIRKEVGNLEKQADVDEKRLDALRARATDIQLFVTILLGLGTLYAASQAVFAYSNLQNARNEIDKAIKDVRASGDRLQDEQRKEWEEARKEFPRFAGMAKVLGSVFGHLLSILESKDVAQNLFDELSADDRQRVFFYEKSVAGLGYLDVQNSREESLKVFRGLGIFYSSKYQSESAKGLGSRMDLDRGEFYFEMALDAKPNDYRVLNDKGKIQADVYDDRGRAEKLWKQSLSFEPRQQRAYYNLGTSAHERNSFQEAINLLRKGIEQDRWEEKKNPLIEGSLHYNLACSLCRAVEEKPEPALVDQALIELRTAIKLNPNLAGKIATDRDLRILTGSSGEAELLKLLRS